MRRSLVPLTEGGRRMWDSQQRLQAVAAGCSGFATRLRQAVASPLFIIKRLVSFYRRSYLGHNLLETACVQVASTYPI